MILLHKTNIDCNDVKLCEFYLYFQIRQTFTFYLWIIEIFLNMNTTMSDSLISQNFSLPTSILYLETDDMKYQKEIKNQKVMYF